MEMLAVTFVDIDGTENVIDDAEVDMTLMEVGKAKGVAGILADCGGASSCATCHVYISDEWMALVGPPNSAEMEMLDMSGHVQPGSRLSCQIKLRPELHGLKVTVAPF